MWITSFPLSFIGCFLLPLLSRPALILLRRLRQQICAGGVVASWRVERDERVFPKTCQCFGCRHVSSWHGAHGGPPGLLYKCNARARVCVSMFVCVCSLQDESEKSHHTVFKTRQWKLFCALRVREQLERLLGCQTVISFPGGQRHHLFSAQKEADLGDNAPPLVRNQKAVWSDAFLS